MIHIIENPSLVTDICQKDFDCLPPHPNFGDVVAIIENEKIKAFMCREMLFHVGTVWVNEEDRGTTKGVKWLRDLMRYVILSLPPGSSAVVLDEMQKNQQLLEFLGFQKRSGDFYRMDFKDTYGK